MSKKMIKAITTVTHYLSYHNKALQHFSLKAKVNFTIETAKDANRALYVARDSIAQVEEELAKVTEKQLAKSDVNYVVVNARCLVKEAKATIEQYKNLGVGR
jgi:molybdenum cofactor biosynthesis enzyme MoaA